MVCPYPTLPSIRRYLFLKEMRASPSSSSTRKIRRRRRRRRRNWTVFSSSTKGKSFELNRVEHLSWEQLFPSPLPSLPPLLDRLLISLTAFQLSSFSRREKDVISLGKLWIEIGRRRSLPPSPPLTSIIDRWSSSSSLAASTYYLLFITEKRRENDDGKWGEGGPSSRTPLRPFYTVHWWTLFSM